jgi:hypothetical protein
MSPAGTVAVEVQVNRPIYVANEPCTRTCSRTGRPASGTGRPASGTGRPASGVRRPASWTGQPAREENRPAGGGVGIGRSSIAGGSPLDGSRACLRPIGGPPPPTSREAHRALSGRSPPYREGRCLLPEDGEVPVGDPRRAIALRRAQSVPEEGMLKQATREAVKRRGSLVGFRVEPLTTGGIQRCAVLDSKRSTLRGSRSDRLPGVRGWLGFPLGTVCFGTNYFRTACVGTPRFGTAVYRTPCFGTARVRTASFGTPRFRTSRFGTAVYRTPCLGTPRVRTASFRTACHETACLRTAHRTAGPFPLLRLVEPVERGCLCGCGVGSEFGGGGGCA